MHLAQTNIGRLVAPIDDPRIRGFVEQLDSINKLADESPGFVWRLQSQSGNATDILYSDADPSIMLNMSVWESLEALKAYVYRSRHVHVLKDRPQWFEKMDLPHYCLWWVPVGDIPTVAEGRERLEHFQAHGESPYAFWFSQAAAV
jgi:heme-degrading monooxygenase HmoA